MSLDLAAAERQTITRSVRDEDVQALKEGRLVMAPHPAWNLPADPTWQEDPFHDRNWCFQYHMLRWLDPLRRAGARGDTEAAELWLRWVQDWAAKNPPSAPCSPWAWTDMSDGIRAQQLCLAAPMVQAVRPGLMDWLESTIRVHGEHLADPRNMGNANHALHQQESLFVVGRVLGDEGMWRLAAQRMSILLHEQYDAQGVNAEGAVAYHANNFQWWERALERFDREGLARPDGAERHLHAPEELAHATRPDGTFVTIGDTDRATAEPVGSPLTDYVTNNGATGRPPQETVRIYDAGYVFARSGWGGEGRGGRSFADETFYSLRFGPSQSVHGHPDGGSLTYSASGVNWIVDPGKYEYGSSPARRHVASRRAHSLVTVDERTPRRSASVELVSRTITPAVHDLTVVDDSFSRVSLRRRVIHSVRGEYLVVLDDVQSRKPALVSQRWQLGPEVSADVEDAAGLGARLRLSCGGALATLCVLAPVELSMVTAQEEPFDGWVATGWRQKAPATAVTASRAGSTVRIATVLAAAPRGADTPPTVQVLSQDPDGLFLSLAVDTGAVQEVMTVTASGVDVAEPFGSV